MELILTYLLFLSGVPEAQANGREQQLPILVRFVGTYGGGVHSTS